MSDASSPESSPPSSSRLWLRRADQAAAAGLLVVSLAAIALYWGIHGGHQGRMIDIDQQPRREASFHVDINTAGWPEFALLPGIGEAKAKAIVQSREKEGPFDSIHDLRRVNGIGPRTLDKLRPYLAPFDVVAGHAQHDEPLHEKNRPGEK